MKELTETQTMNGHRSTVRTCPTCPTTERSQYRPIPDRRCNMRTAMRGRCASTSRQVAAVSIEAVGVRPDGAVAGADLGGSTVANIQTRTLKTEVEKGSML